MTSTTDNVQPIYSSLASDPNFTMAVDKFVNELADHIDSLQKSFSSGDWDSLRNAAQQLSVQANTNGFNQLVPLISAIADRASGPANAQEVAGALETLAEAGGRVRTGVFDCKILLAEDGPDNQKLIKYVLTKAGAEVEVAENGQIAMQLALDAQSDGTPFDLILMDMQMPVMDGYTATRRLRETGYESLIVALTAHDTSSDRDQCLEAGCDEFATKPIDIKKLISMVRDCLERSR